MKITPSEQRELAARAMTTPQNLDHRGIRAKHTAKKNKASALSYADAMLNIASQSQRRAGVLLEFSGVVEVTDYAVGKMCDYIGCELSEFETNVNAATVASAGVDMKSWMRNADACGFADEAAKISGAWEFFVAGEWDHE